MARRTVIRWISGEVSRITTDNLQNLAKAVELSPAELSSELSLEQSASASEQQQAADTLLSYNTGELFLRSQNYEAFERMLSAVRHPNMTMHQLAQVYLHMAAAAAMQHEFARATEQFRHCIACAQRCQNLNVEFAARVNLAVIHSETGDVARMHDELEVLLAMMESQQVTRPYRSVCINISRACQLMGQLARAAAFAIDAVRLYSSTRDHLSYCESLVLAAGICMDLDSPQLALDYLAVANAVASEQNLAIWTPPVRLRQMEAAAQLGEQLDPAEVLRSLDQYDQISYIPIDCYHAAVRALFMSGEASLAVQLINRGLERPWMRPQEKAMLLLELAIIRRRSGNLEHFAQPAREAAALFEAGGMQSRADSALRFAQGGEEPYRHSNDGLLAMLQAALPLIPA